MNRCEGININRRQALRDLGFLGIGAAMCCGCRTAPVSGRPQLIVMPEQRELALGDEAFQEKIKTETRSTNQRLVQMVQRVGRQIAAVSERDGYQWEFELFSGPTQNAFCLPGGKVAIYEGILPVCENEAGLAVVMSHEIAHALARHGGERMSQSMAVDGARMIAEKLAGKYTPEKKDLLMQAYGLGSKYGVLLPYNRRQESEADHIGVMLMAKAGYDPSVAPEFWLRFGELKQGGQTPEFLSTHPNDARRAQDLEGWLLEARELYSHSKQKFGLGEQIA